MDEPRTRRLTPADWPSVAGIYAEGMATGDATFETELPTWDGWDADHLPEPRLVAEHGGEVVGWAALAPVSGRPVYAGVAEVSLYVSAAARRTGVGRVLLQSLVEAADGTGLWTLQAGIFPENAASIRVHEACGFRVVGVRERLGRQGTRWRDVVLPKRRGRLATAHPEHASRNAIRPDPRQQCCTRRRGGGTRLAGVAERRPRPAEIPG